MTKRTVEIDDTLPEIIEALKTDIESLLDQWLSENHDIENGEPDTPDWSDLDYSGLVHEMIDSAVPVYCSEIKDLFYLHGGEFEEAFDNAGIGSKGDKWPSGWKPAAIYCYLEQVIGEWYSNEADDMTEDWYKEKTAASE